MCTTQRTPSLLNIFKSTFKALLPFIIALEVVQRDRAILSWRLCYWFPDETAINNGYVQSLMVEESPGLIYINISQEKLQEN